MRTGLLLGLVALVLLAPAAFIGGWAGLATGIVGAIVGWGIYRATRRTPGRFPCPKCKSTQTQEIWSRGPDASEPSVWLCAACGHQWDLTHLER